jgi:hypothetical protein
MSLCENIQNGPARLGLAIMKHARMCLLRQTIRDIRPKLGFAPCLIESVLVTWNTYTLMFPWRTTGGERIYLAAGTIAVLVAGTGIRILRPVQESKTSDRKGNRRRPHRAAARRPSRWPGGAKPIRPAPPRQRHL